MPSRLLLQTCLEFCMCSSAVGNIHIFTLVTFLSFSCSVYGRATITFCGAMVVYAVGIPSQFPFPSDISSFSSENTKCELLQVWYVIDCHREQHRGYKYQHLCIENRQMLWCFYGPSETRLPVTDEGVTSDWHLIYKSVLPVYLQVGPQTYTPPGTAIMRFIQHNSICTSGSGGEPAQSFVHPDPAGMCWRRRVSVISSSGEDMTVKTITAESRW